MDVRTHKSSQERLGRSAFPSWRALSESWNVLQLAWLVGAGQEHKGAQAAAAFLAATSHPPSSNFTFIF